MPLLCFAKKWSFKRQRRSPRKAQLSEVRHPDPARPAELRVITPEGVTVLGPGSGAGSPVEPPQLPPRGTGRPLPPPVPPSRNASQKQLQLLDQQQQNLDPEQSIQPLPLPVPVTATSGPSLPAQSPTQETSPEDSEMRALEATLVERRAATPAVASSSSCPSPELPLPPPPPLDQEIAPSDEPLPPPPPDLAPLVDGVLASLAHTQKMPVYPKNSYMCYVSVRKPCRRHGYEGNYRRSQNVSPPCRELDHLTCEGSPHLAGPNPACPCPSPPDCRTSPTSTTSSPPHTGNTSPTVMRESCDTSHVTQNPDRELSRTLSEMGHTTLQQDHEHTNRSSVLKDNRTTHKTENYPITLDNQNINIICNNNSNINNNNVMLQQAGNTEVVSKSQLNRVNSHARSIESKSRLLQESGAQQTPRDSYIVLPIDLGEGTQEEEIKDISSQQQDESREASQHMETEQQTILKPCRKNRENSEQLAREEEVERLSRSFAERCPDPALRNILVPGPDRVQLWDYMQGVFSKEDLPCRNKDTGRSARQPRQQPLLQDSKEIVSQNNNIIQQACPDKPKPQSVDSSKSAPTVAVSNELPAHSAYFTTSEPKAKLLTWLSQTDLLNGQSCASDSELGKKKEELISSIGRKLSLLRSEQLGLQDEVAQNEMLGREVSWRVEAAAKPNELQKYRLHVEETEKILNLLMSLSGRLARAQNALRALPADADPDERHLLEAKRDKLSSQHEEARTLKESLDRRGRQVEAFLKAYLSEEEFGDYLHFVAMKAKLLVDARELDEKIRLGEEQLTALERRTRPSEPSRTGSTAEWNRNAGATSV